MKNPSPTIAEIRKIYHEFGIDIHEVPASIQPQINKLAMALIKERQKRKNQDQ